MPYNKTKIIACTSFKGGSGRTVSTANLAFQLAKKYRVGCIDFDIEAGGLHFVFEAGRVNKLSIQHLLMDKEDYRQLNKGTSEVPNFDDKTFFVNRLCIDIKETPSPIHRHKEFKGELFFIQAELDANLTSRVDTSLMAFTRFNKLLENFSSFLNLDYILIDCRSGISNLGLPGLSFCDLALVFLRWGTQHRNGTKILLKWYSEWLEKAEFPAKIFLVPSTINPEITSNESIHTFFSECEPFKVVGYTVLPEIDELKKQDRIIIEENRQTPYKNLASSVTELL